MKKKTVFLFLLLAALLLAGCAPEPPASDAAPEPEVTNAPDLRRTDEEFVAAVGRALQARWDLSAGYMPQELAAMRPGEYQDYLRRCVAAEEAELGSILDYRFLDSELAALAQQYYYALSLQRGGAEFARTDSRQEYNDSWVLGYYYRVSALYELSRDFSLRVEDAYAARLTELLSAHYEAKKQIAFHELTVRLPETLVYEKDPSRSDGSQACYVGRIDNTTQYDIKSLSILVSFLDADGQILFQSSDWISDLRAGMSARSTVFAADEDYAGMQFSLSIYQ